METSVGYVFEGKIVPISRVLVFYRGYIDYYGNETAECPYGVLLDCDIKGVVPDSMYYETLEEARKAGKGNPEYYEVEYGEDI